VGRKNIIFYNIEFKGHSFYYLFCGTFLNLFFARKKFGFSETKKKMIWNNFFVHFLEIINKNYPFSLSYKTNKESK